MTDRTVWSNWQRENLWGNLRTSADPIARDNVMFSGYLALMLGTYAATSGDVATTPRDHSPSPGTAPGPTATTTPGSSKRSSGTSGALRGDCFPCEPGLVFPLCNAVAMLGLAAFDGITGATRTARLWPGFRRGLDEEFTHPDGDVVPFVATRLAVRAGVMRSPQATALLGFFLHPLAPELSRRWWTVARSELVHTGRLRPESLPGSGQRITGDWGTGEPSHASTYAAVLALARELGDQHAYRQVLAAADAHLGWSVRDGVGCYERCSVNANALLGMAWFGGRDTFRRWCARGPSSLALASRTSTTRRFWSRPP